MLRNRIYYSVKPFLPQRLRLGLRRWFTRRLHPRFRGTWPISPGSEQPPPGWTGWPEGKQFAVVLTHDVEGPQGLEKCRQLMQLEQELGFRSSFNFIPEGEYRVSAALREELVRAGFEVGIHDLKHDGRLYHSRREFQRHATKINAYLREWGAVGFRSGFMLHKLDWLHQLDIAYDASTFDTDPFEPQPEGRNTIFPFWVERDPEVGTGSGAAALSHRRSGYVELPYTLPQDSTLFLLLGETTPAIWLRKLDWIAQHGGMALINVHPDYLRFEGQPPSDRTCSAAHYRALLEHISTRYPGAFWNPTPRALASWYAKSHGRLDAASHPANVTLPLIHPPGHGLKGKRAAVLLFSHYPADPRPRRAAEAMVQAGMEVDLICLQEKGEEAAQETIHGVQVRRVPLRKKRDSKLTYVLQYASFILTCFGLLALRMPSRRYDVVHVHNMPDALVFSALIPRIFGAKIILDLHDPMPELMTSIYGFTADHWLVRLLRLVERWSIGFSHLSLTPNITFRNLFISRSCSPDKMQIVMNSPEDDIFDPNRYAADAPLPRREEEFRIMHHGSIVHRHGVDLLIEAVARVRSTIPGVRLDIYGARTEFLDEVLGVAERLGIAEIVHFHGPKSQLEIAEAIHQSDLGVVPNRRSPFTELNFPTRLFEYLAMNRAVIAPSTRGIRDYFAAEEIIMFEPEDVDDLVDKILWTYQNRENAALTVARGRRVYRQNLWGAEKERLISGVEALLPGSPAGVTKTAY